MVNEEERLCPECKSPLERKVKQETINSIQMISCGGISSPLFQSYTSKVSEYTCSKCGYQEK